MKKLDKLVNKFNLLHNNQIVSIEWEYEGGGQCHLFLYENNQYLSTIYDFANNDGEFTWAIPDTLPESNCYQIVIGYLGDGSSPGDLPNNDYDYIVSSYFFITAQTDFTPPLLSLDDLPENIGTGQEIDITWSVSDDATISSIDLFISYDSLNSSSLLESFDEEVEQQ